MLRKLLFLAFLPLVAFAQYAPPPNYPTQNSTTPFWAAGLTSNLASSTSSARVVLSVPTSSQAPQVQVNNTAASAVAYVVCAGSTVTAAVGSAGTATSSYPVAPGSVIVMTPQAGSTHCAAILSTSTGTVYFTPGAGQ